MNRKRLPNRRKVITTTLAFGNHRIAASIGFDSDGRPQEIFLSGARDGSELAALLNDASVVISIALQCGLSAHTLRHSISRLPIELDGPAVAPASIIGLALDLIVEESGEGAGR